MGFKGQDGSRRGIGWIVINEIASALSSTKVAVDIIRGLRDLEKDVALSTKIFELNNIIIDIQGKMFSIQKKHHETMGQIARLESDNARFKDWEIEKRRYKLVELLPGTFVYRLKQDCAQGEPLHDLCPECYQDGRKSILQRGAPSKNHESFVCNSCHTSLLGKRLTSPCIEFS
jgi:hypothetical protein